MAKLTSNKPLLIGGVAALSLLGAGALYFAMQTQPPSPTAATGEPHAADEAAETVEGFIELTSDQIKAAGIAVVGVGQGGGAETRLSGRVQPMVDARAVVAASVGGRVERVLIAPGQTVRAGQALVSLVSGDAASLRAEADAAQAAYVAAEQSHGRDEELAEQGVIAMREAEVSHAQALSAQATARAAQARAAAAGSPDLAGRLSVTSPISGVVANVLVGPGGFVAQGGVVAEVTNPARVELVFNAPPALAATVQTGARLRATGPTGEFDATVIGVAVNAGASDSGATVIRARPIGAGLPPAGSAVTGSIVTGQPASGALTVPSEAIQTLEGVSVVFVQVRNGFQATQVLAGRQASGRTEILRGLDGSERIASTNAFLLKAELAKGEAEHGH